MQENLFKVLLKKIVTNLA